MLPSLLLLSGPSCIGKSPLVNTVRRFYPEWGSKLQKLMLFNNRAPRPGEVDGEDYHFRSHAEVISYQGKPGFITIPVRNDWQALELETIFQIQEQGKIPLFEGNPYLVEALREVGLFERIPATTVFLSPLSKEEIVYLRQPSRHVDLPVFVTQVMRKKQLRRKQKQMGLLSQPDLEDIEIRCQAAYAEMRYAWQYDYVIPNHDGEDSENWSAFYYPLGDARRAVEGFVSILKEDPLPWLERWDEGLLP